MKKRFIKNIPNIITSTRIIASIIAPIMFVLGNLPLAIGLYIYGAISDAFDGMAARKLNAFTKLGKKLDPISDKIFALSLIVPSLCLGNYLMILPLLLEGIIAYTNYKIVKKHKDFQTERVGKVKTNALFPEAIVALIATKVPLLYIAFAPLYVITTYLQLQTINAYKNQLSYKDQQIKEIKNEKEDSNNKEEIKEEPVLVKETTKSKLEDLKKELIGYACNPIKRKDIKRKELKNDRYKHY